VPPLARETLGLLLAHLDLFTRIALTVWLPAVVAANYQNFFAAAERGAPRGLAVVLATEVVLGPLVAAATIAALARLTHGLPARYWEVMADGLAAWPRLFAVRLVNGLIIAAGILALLVPGLILLVRYALVDPVAVLEAAGPAEARRRSLALTAGQRWDIALTGGALFVLVWMASLAVSSVIQAVPELNHFVVRVLVDCAFAVAQTIFTIALFLFYQRSPSAPARPGPPAVPAA
jgi:hypothetical protein